MPVTALVVIITASMTIGALIMYGWIVRTTVKLDSNDDWDCYIVEQNASPRVGELFHHNGLTLESFDLLPQTEYHLAARDICKENWGTRMMSLSEKQRKWIGRVVGELVAVSK